MKTNETEDVRQGENRPMVMRILIISGVIAVIVLAGFAVFH